MSRLNHRISQRIAHTKISEGYCLICGQYGSLSWDHVPPKGAIAITRVEQRHITEMMGTNAKKIKGIRSRNGSKFRTICHNCNNNHIGNCDQEVATVFNFLSSKVKTYFECASSPHNFVSENVNATKFARAMIGHILAATSVNECLRAPQETPYFTPLQKFVLGDDKAIQHTHNIYYWFYPYTKHLSAKILSFWNNGNLSVVSLLSFFPIAFMVVEKGTATYPAHARQLKLNDSKLYLDLSSRGFEFAEFPFHGLKGDQMMALSDQMAIVSYPIGQ
ncbi:hypothetical protein A28LD_1386 [Idiomarina sp. A28L]|uniref:hypothetical protein n=1 Tax=Idiomarina sp. A28L TaxID=1036674 RepID=UPI00021388B0|nr:hypothetical protein [Idiomarina sp. A28L]EGN75120.1 hypothetical protein A28LD_1386 [Idiomarina sp. A28L]